jgi:Protein of unknown function (DUF2911)
MKIQKGYIIVGLIIAFALFFELAAHADELDLNTTITFSQPVQVPGQVLPAGTYVFRLADPADTQNIVQIFNSDRTVLYATLQTIPAERRQPTDDTAVTLAKQGPGKPHALLKWFYPARKTGNEFVYSKQEEKALAQDTQQTVVAN